MPEFLQLLIYSVFLLIIFITGSLMLLIGIALLRRCFQLSRKGIRVTGVVIGEHLASRDPESDRQWTVKYADQSGQSRQNHIEISSDANPKAGQPIKLILDPDNPNDACHDSRSTIWTAPLVCCTLGAASVVAVIIIVVNFVNQHML